MTRRTNSFRRRDGLITIPCRNVEDAAPNLKTREIEHEIGCGRIPRAHVWDPGMPTISDGIPCLAPRGQWTPVNWILSFSLRTMFLS